MILRVYTTPHDTRRHGRVVQDGREIQALSLPMTDRIFNVEHVDTADHLIHRAEAEFSHVLTNLLGNEEEEIDYVLGLALEAFAQFGILRRDAHRTRVQVALAHHDAA